MKVTEALKVLADLGKPFFKIADLEKALDMDRRALGVALSRWTKAGIMRRIARGVYVPLAQDVPAEVVAAQLYLPNYLSFESALARYGILTLIPHTLTFATSRKTRRYTIAGRDVEFRQIQRRLFWGFTSQAGIYLAEKEKAFLDQVYLARRGLASLDLDEIDLRELSRTKLTRYARAYPPAVRAFLRKCAFPIPA